MNTRYLLKTLLTISALGLTVPALSMNVEHARECKNIVMTETAEFSDIPMAAISLTKGGDGIKWNIHWQGQTANGICVFHHNEFKKLKIKHHLKDHSKQKKGPDYSGKYGGFYFDHHVGQWRDPDGGVCHTCTPENGFPRRGG